MIKREIGDYISAYLKKFPIVTLIGVRQCGKSTLLKNALPEYKYVSLEDPDIRDFAAEDPRGFLRSYSAPCIIDEAQRVPMIFSYIQTDVDKSGEVGQYVLSGSHNFILMESISQSLAGRTAVLTLAPLSLSEMSDADMLSDNIDDILIKGGYPAIHSRGILPSEYFPSYSMTYIERDVRLIRNIPDADLFIRFIRLLAARSGQIVNHSELANACNISVPTVRAWLSVLMQSYIVYELSPFYNNYSKRLIKSRKLYFYDTGLLCYLLGIESVERLAEHPMRGSIFETMVVGEYYKSRLFRALEPRAYFWRDTNQNEVDLLTEDDGCIKAYEIKSGETMDRKYLRGLQKLSDISEGAVKELACIYAGKNSIYSEKGSFINYLEAFKNQ